MLLILQEAGYYNQEFNNWSFQNQSYLGFNQDVNFTIVPSPGLPHDESILGYWNMNEDLDILLQDSSVNGNNGTITGTTIVEGMYGNARSFNGVSDYVYVSSNPASLGLMYTYSVSAWVKWDNTQTTTGWITSHGWYLRFGIQSDGAVRFDYLNVSYAWTGITSSVKLDGEWHFIVGVLKQNDTNEIANIYIDGILDSTANLSGNPLYHEGMAIGCYGSGSSEFFKGIVDDIRIYNRALSSSEVAISHIQPEPASLVNYFNYQSQITNDTMLIDINNPNENTGNSSLVTCTDFFVGNRLAFQANNSVIVNVWTNLGQPSFTTGIWNIQNHTTTLTLDASSAAELNWNRYDLITYTDAHSTVLPSNNSVAYGASQNLNFNSTKGYSYDVKVDGEPQGQINSYFFKNVTSSHIVELTSTILKYTIEASADSHIAMTPVGTLPIIYGGSQLFTMQPDEGYNIEAVYIDGIDLGAISNYTFNDIKSNHNIYVTASVINFTIAASSGPNGTITPSGSVSLSYGQNQQFNFTAKTGYHVSRVLVDNLPKAVDNFYKFSNVQKNSTLNVSFDINTYQIKTSSDAYSIITPGNITVKYGENQKFNVITSTDYVCRVYVDGIDHGNITSYNFTDVQGNHTIVVTSKHLYTLTPSPIPSSNPASFPPGSQQPQPNLATQQPIVIPQTDQTNQVPPSTAIIAVIIGLIFIIVDFAFKKGYLSIEVVEEKENLK